MSPSAKEMEDGEGDMSEDKDNGSRDEVVIPQRNVRKDTTAAEKKIGEKSQVPMFAEEVLSSSRKETMGAKKAKDRRQLPSLETMKTLKIKTVG
jgi:ribosome assembly protein YihI (activator of Der GTPase)